MGSGFLPGLFAYLIIYGVNDFHVFFPRSARQCGKFSIFLSLRFYVKSISFGDGDSRSSNNAVFASIGGRGSEFCQFENFILQKLKIHRYM